MDKFLYTLPGEPVADFHSVGVSSAGLAHGRGELHAWILTFEPGGSIGTHTAGFDQLFYVLEGSAWVVCDGVRLELAEHEAATIDLGDIHSKGSDAGASVLMIQISSLDSPRG